jgi:integrase
MTDVPALRLWEAARCSTDTKLIRIGRIFRWGDLALNRGLKRRARKRVLKIKCRGQRGPRTVGDGIEGTARFQPGLVIQTKKLDPWVLESQMGRLRDKIKTDPDAGLHALRHMFLTEAGEDTDAFTLQYIAGHETIKTTMRSVHPRAESVSRRSVGINRKKRPAQAA